MSQTEATTTGTKSYTSNRMGLRARATELYNLYRKASQVGETVQISIGEVQQAEREIRERYGVELKGGRALELGSGPNSLHAAYLALSNDVVGIDTNIVPKTTDVLGWVEMTRHNGALRTVKTLGRRALGVDRNRRRAFCQATGASRWPAPEMLEMSAQELTFPDASIDFVFSRAVFEHLPDPAQALDGVKRVLKPGGTMALIFHLYTSDSGCHDSRIIAGQRDELPYWSHLRPGKEHLVQQNAWLNKLHLGEWKEIFAKELPGSELFTVEEDSAPLRAALAEVRAAGELPSFTDEELMCPTVWAVWQKPATA